MPGTLPEWLQDDGLPIIVTEGEKKTLALYRLCLLRTENNQPRFLAFGLGGVWNWRGTVGETFDKTGARGDVKGPIPDIDLIKWDGRTVYIAFDANTATNKNVRSARQNLANELKRRGASVLLVDLPQIEGVNGVDDLLATKGEAFVLGLIEEAKPTSDVKVPAGFRISEKGFYAVDPTGEKDDTFVCSPLKIAAATRNQDGEDWGRLLEFSDLDGGDHYWSMPMSLLSGDGSEFRSRLLSAGLAISPSRKGREALTTFIQSSRPNERVLCVPRVGWHNGSYVLPDETIGPAVAERILLQTASDAGLFTRQ